MPTKLDRNFTKRYIEERLIGADFTALDLGGTLFWGCDLRNADFSGSNLKDAAIIACDIRSAKFTHCNLENIDMSGSVFNSLTLHPDDKEFWDEKTHKILARSREKFNVI